MERVHGGKQRYSSERSMEPQEHRASMPSKQSREQRSNEQPACLQVGQAHLLPQLSW